MYKSNINPQKKTVEDNKNNEQNYQQKEKAQNPAKINWVQFICVQGSIILFLLICKSYNYDLFHFFIEGYSIVVSLCIYFIVINSKRGFQNNFLIIISIGFLFVALLDTLHILSYKGMNIFNGYDSNLPTQLWIYSRYLQSITIISAVILMNKAIRIKAIYGGFFPLAVIGALLIFTRRFPDAFIEGSGLTVYKIISEYIIIATLLLSLYLIQKKKDFFDNTLYRFILHFIMFSILSDFMFTLYADPFDIMNLLGHYFKYLSIYFIYRSVIKLTILQPQNIIFRELELKKNDLEQEVKEYVIQLETINRKNNALIDNFQEQLFVLDKRFLIMECYLPKTNLLRLREELVLNKSFDDIGFPKSAVEIIKNSFYKTLHTGKPERAEYYIDMPEGKYWYDAQLSIIPGGEDFEERILCSVRDITTHVVLEGVIYNEKEQFRATLLSVGDGIIATDRYGTIVVMNPVAEALTEYSKEEAYGQPVEQVFRVVSEYTKEISRSIVQKVLETGRVNELSNHSLLISKSGKEISIEDCAAPILDRNGYITGVVIVFRDCTDKQMKIKQIEYLSFHDHLTGLYNRRYMEDSIQRLDTERNFPITMMVLDVNGLKLTNDAFGHEKGDQLIKAVAEILNTVCRSDDIISRIGGDEFAILLPNTDKFQAEGIKKRIVKATMNTKIDSVVLSLSIGYAVKTEKEQDIQDIFIEADNNMYKDKIKFGKLMRSQTIETLLRNINNKYDSEQIHTERVSQYCVAIAKVMELTEKQIDELKIAGILHDIGKIIVPSELLNKPERLNEAEMQMIRQHSQTGYQILKGVDEYVPFAEAVLYHHERWDGKGYPRGLKGDQIPLYSRIIAIADTYEAMTAVRGYQSTRTAEEAVEELRRCSGTQFDPQIAKVFIEKVLLHN